MKNTYRFLESDWTERSFQIQDEIRQQVGWVDLSVEQTIDGYTDVCFSCPDPEEGQTDPVEAMATLMADAVEEEPLVEGKETMIDEKTGLEIVDLKAGLQTELKASIPTRLTVSGKAIPMMLKTVEINEGL
jgi:hypothetical protein